MKKITMLAQSSDRLRSSPEADRWRGGDPPLEEREGAEEGDASPRGTSVQAEPQECWPVPVAA